MKQRNKHPSESHAAIAPAWRNRRGPAFLFDLDGMARWSTAFYQHVLAWREALEEAGIDLSVWRIHRRIGMSGGLFHALLRETRRKITPQGAEHLQKLHAKAYAVCHTSATVAGRAEITQVSLEDQRSLRHRDQRPHGERRPYTRDFGVPSHVPVVTRDQVRYAKPDPDLFLAAAERLGVAIDDSVVVGDSVWDLLAARRAQAIGVGLLSGGYGEEELERAGAYRVYQDPLDLLNHLDEVRVRVRA